MISASLRQRRDVVDVVSHLLERSFAVGAFVLLSCKNALNVFAGVRADSLRFARPSRFGVSSLGFWVSFKKALDSDSLRRHVALSIFFSPSCGGFPYGGWVVFAKLSRFFDQAILVARVVLGGIFFAPSRVFYAPSLHGAEHFLAVFGSPFFGGQLKCFRIFFPAQSGVFARFCALRFFLGGGQIFWQDSFSHLVLWSGSLVRAVGRSWQSADCLLAYHFTEVKQAVGAVA